MRTSTTVRFGAGVTVFLLFFGVAALEAFQTRNWIKAAFWLAIGFVFLITDSQSRSQNERSRT